MKKYGREGTIFIRRIDVFDRTAATYFVKHPSQEIECEVKQIISDARTLSASRNFIAHGVVEQFQTVGHAPIEGDPDTYTDTIFLLTSALYAKSRKLEDGVEYHDSHSIYEEAVKFSRLSKRIRGVGHNLFPGPQT